MSMICTSLNDDSRYLGDTIGESMSPMELAMQEIRARQYMENEVVSWHRRKATRCTARPFRI